MVKNPLVWPFCQRGTLNDDSVLDLDHAIGGLLFWVK